MHCALSRGHIVFPKVHGEVLSSSGSYVFGTCVAGMSRKLSGVIGLHLSVGRDNEGSRLSWQQEQIPIRTVLGDSNVCELGHLKADGKHLP